MTESELILADIILLKIPINTAFRCNGLMHNVLIGLSDKYSPEIYQEITKIVISQNSIIRDFLLKQKYTVCIDNSTHLDILTEKGEKAQELKGHAQFLIYKSKEDRKDKWSNIPKKYWHFVAIGTFILGLISGLLKDKIEAGLNPKTPQASPPPIQVAPILHDTVYIYRIDTSKKVKTHISKKGGLKH